MEASFAAHPPPHRSNAKRTDTDQADAYQHTGTARPYIGWVPHIRVTCPRCAYDLRSLSSPTRCPECGLGEPLSQPIVELFDSCRWFGQASVAAVLAHGLGFASAVSVGALLPRDWAPFGVLIAACAWGLGGLASAAILLPVFNRRKQVRMLNPDGRNPRLRRMSTLLLLSAILSAAGLVPVFFIALAIRHI
jgi:hypothetical protein